MNEIGKIKAYFKAHRHLAVFLMLVFLNLAIYWKILGMFFISDDFDWLNLSQQIQNGWLGILTGNYYGLHGVGGTFRPMVNVIFAIENFLFGLNPFGYHAVQLLLHIGVAFLIYLIVGKVLISHKNGNRIAFLSAAIFSIMPNHVEAVVWIAAVGDPLATLLYLLSFYFYVVARSFQYQISNFKYQISNRKYLLSLLFFILALLTKEIAITLPFVILAYELMIQKNYRVKSLFQILNSYFLILIAYLIYRYWAIGLLFGYYGRESLAGVLHIKEYIITLINISASMFTVGQMRIDFGHLIVKGWFVILPLIILLAILLWYKTNFEQRHWVGFLIIFWLFNIALILPLKLGIINDEGQRYGYLPSIAVAIVIVWIIIALMKYSNRLVRTVIILTVCYCVLFQQMLVNQWGISSTFSNRIYHQLSSIDFQTPEKTYIIGLPESYLNAQLYRNGIIQSLELQGIKFDPQKVVRVPVYVHLDDTNRESELYGEKKEYDDGFLWTTIDNKYIVTGNATETYPDYHFELWGYNYGNATANHIRMYFDSGDWQKFKDGKVQILYFDEGNLKKYVITQ